VKNVLRDSTATNWSVFGVSVLVWFALAAGGMRRPRTDGRLTVALVVLALAQLVVYGPVHVEVRFLGIAWLYGWLAAATLIGAPAPASAARATVIGAAIATIAAVAAIACYLVLPPALGSPRELACALGVSVVLLVAFTRIDWRTSALFAICCTAAAAPWCASIAKNIAVGVGPVQRRDVAIVRALRAAHVPDGAAIASVNATFPASWARAGRWHIAIEIAKSRAPAFWKLSDAERAPMLRALARGDVAAIVGVLEDGDPRPTGWIVADGSTAVILPASRIPR
jgi:hypothetical protein